MKHYGVLNGEFGHETMYPCQLVKTEGNYLIDTNGKQYLDLRSGLWNVTLGYDHDIYQEVSRRFNETLQQGLAYLDMHSFQHQLYDEVAKKILVINQHHFSKVIYTNSGSENTEVALKIANYINKKSASNKILAFNHSYHGTFFGGVAVSGIDQELNESFHPKYGHVTFIDYPTQPEQERTILEQVMQIAKDYDVMFIEPVLSSQGVYLSSIDFLNELMVILKKNNVLIVMDEVATGFYKTGDTFFYHKLAQAPDMLSLSKAINNGIVPFGCLCISEAVNTQLLNSDKTMEHFSTQNGNLLGMISTEVVIDYYQQHQQAILNKVHRLSTIINETLTNDHIVYRNIGIMTAIDLSPTIDIEQCVAKLTNSGILIYAYINGEEQGIIIMPQFDIDEAILKQALEKIVEIIK